MRVLLLSPYPEGLLPAFSQAGDEVLISVDPLDLAILQQDEIRFIISYGYRHLIRKPVLDLLPGRIVNLHISLLPWNRGSDPNLWSWVEDTPKGVTIHNVDEGLDTGDILEQRSVEFAPGATLASSYQVLRSEVEALFREAWPRIRDMRCRPVPQDGTGSRHLAREKTIIMDRLPQGWDSPVEEVRELGRRLGLGSGQG